MSEEREFEMVKIEELTPYENNPRTHSTEQVKQLQKSIKEFGFTNPILIDENNMVIAGHGRLMAAKEIGMETVPVYKIKDLTIAQKKAYIIADNQLALNAGWDEEILKKEMESLKNMDFDLDLLGFPEIDLIFDDNINNDSVDPVEVVEDDFNVDEALDEQEEPTAKQGDIWQLGRHRLMCGDSTSLSEIERLMGGKKADLVFTDPPYGMKKEKDGVLNDNLNFKDLLDFNKKWVPITFSNLKDNGSWYCWGIDEPLMDIYSEIIKPMIAKQQATFRNLITWNKGFGQGQNSEDFRMYAPADEKCLFVMCGVQGFNNNSDNYFEGWEPIRDYLFTEWRKISSKNDWDKHLGNCMGSHWFTKSQWEIPTEKQYNKLQILGQSNDAFNKEYNAFKKEYDELKKEYDELKKEYYSTRAYFDNVHDNMNNVWNFSRTSADERKDTGGHATPKPLNLCARAIKSSSRENEIILDVFGGSGSTLIAAEQIDRSCYMCELDPKYVDVIIKRWEKYTSEKAFLLSKC